MYYTIRLLFAFFLVCVFGFAAFESRDFMRLAKYFPFYISLVCFVLSFVQLYLEARKTQDITGNKGEQQAKVQQSDLTTTFDLPMNQVFGNALFYIMYFVVFYILIFLLGLRLAAFIGLFLVFRFQNKLTNWKALIVALAGWIFLIVLSLILNVKIPRGLIHEFVELPKILF